MKLLKIYTIKADVAVSYSSFAIAFAYFVMFNLFDLSSTILALKLGLSRANFALVYLSSSLGLGIADVAILLNRPSSLVREH